MPTLLLDRDGVISENRPQYVTHWRAFRFLPGSVEAMAALRAAGVRLVVITNQSAVGRGLMTAQRLDEIHSRMQAHCWANGAALDAVLVCRHAPEHGCRCRKPRPGLLLRALSIFDERPEACLVIGDSWEDLLAARAAGIAFGLVRTGRGEAALHHPAVRRYPPLFVARDLQHAVTPIAEYFARQREGRVA